VLTPNPAESDRKWLEAAATGRIRDDPPRAWWGSVGGGRYGGRVCDLDRLAGLDVADFGAVVKHTQLAVWMGQLRGDHLTMAGLLDLRARLDKPEFTCECSRSAARSMRAARLRWRRRGRSWPGCQ
jgi:hypothetical protein